jgi:hypothetical protein
MVTARSSGFGYPDCPKYADGPAAVNAGSGEVVLSDDGPGRQGSLPGP